MILKQIEKYTFERVKMMKEAITPEEMILKALDIPTDRSFKFEKALGKKGMSFICEVKKASPSKGVIAPVFPYTDIALEYERSGADAISVLTEPEFFMGDDRYLTEIKENVNVPVLRKDFVVDEYQIYQAAVMGADAILLICRLLDEAQIKKYIGIADSLGLSCLVEAHDGDEIEMALRADARIIGVNNRNLGDFTVDITNSIRLRKLVPDGIIFVSESGIKVRDDVKELEDNDVDAVLIGETFMKSQNKFVEMARLRGEIV